MYKARLSHKSYPLECNDGTELSASIWLCDLSAYKIISTEPHDSGSFQTPLDPRDDLKI